MPTVHDQVITTTLPTKFPQQCSPSCHHQPRSTSACQPRLHTLLSHRPSPAKPQTTHRLHARTLHSAPTFQQHRRTSTITRINPPHTACPRAHRQSLRSRQPPAASRVTSHLLAAPPASHLLQTLQICQASRNHQVPQAKTPFNLSTPSYQYGNKRISQYEQASTQQVYHGGNYQPAGHQQPFSNHLQQSQLAAAAAAAAAVILFIFLRFKI